MPEGKAGQLFIPQQNVVIYIFSSECICFSFNVKLRDIRSMPIFLVLYFTQEFQSTSCVIKVSMCLWLPKVARGHVFLQSLYSESN